MKLLITAGGTSEPIDQVRAITNHSTGRLGKTIADAFLTQDPTIEIDYVTTKHAQLPETHDGLTIHLIESTLELFTCLKQLMTSTTYDGVIHSMAVSDFTPVLHLDEERFLQSLHSDPPTTSEGFDHWLKKTQMQQEQAAKLSSATDHLILVMEQTPKIIQFIHEWQPETVLVGFKLLVSVSKEELLRVAKAALEKNHAQFVLANDLSEITADQHHGYLIAADGSYQEGQTKQALAELIVQAILTQKETKQ